MGVVWFDDESSSSYSQISNHDVSSNNHNDDGLTVVALVASLLRWAAFVVCASCAGACMGAAGVGGVLLVPSAVFVLHVKTSTAVASVAPAYLLTSVSGMRAYRTTLQAPSLRYRVAPLASGAAVGGLMASIALPHLPAHALTMVLAVVCILFGLHKLITITITMVNRSDHREGEDGIIRDASHDNDDYNNNNNNNNDEEKINDGQQIYVQTEADKLLSSSSSSSAAALEMEEQGRKSFHPFHIPFPCDVSLGAVVGFGSTLTGTSGPLLFLPAILLSSLLPCHNGQEISGTHAVALSQIIGAPMALCMTLGTLWLQQQHEQLNDNDTADVAVDIDLGLSLVVGIATSLWVPCGERSMRALRVRLSSGNYGQDGDHLVTAFISLVILGSGVYMLVFQ